MKKQLKYFLLGSVFLVTFYFIYLETNIYTASIASITVLAALLQLSSPVKIWNSLAKLLNPAITMYLGFVTGLTYYNIQNNSFSSSVMFGLGAGMLSFIIGFLLTKYWNV